MLAFGVSFLGVGVGCEFWHWVWVFSVGCVC